MQASSQARFWSKVAVAGKNECWEWQGSLYPTGYGQFWGDGKRSIRAHRVAFALVNGPIPEGKYILHSCDNRRCVNPNHLRVGTQSENLQEAHDKKRMVNNRGTNSAKAKLTCEQVAEIRRRYSAGDRKKNGARALGREFGIAHNKVLNIVNGTSYQDCPVV